MVLWIVKMLLAQRPVPAAVDENFGTVFIVAGRECSSHAVGITGVYQAITKAITPRLMLAGITIEIFPQHRRKDKFGIHRRLQQLAKRRPHRRIERSDIAQRKSFMQLQVAAETHQHDALPVLW